MASESLEICLGREFKSIHPAYFYHLVEYGIKISTNFNNCRTNSPTMTAGYYNIYIIPSKALTKNTYTCSLNYFVKIVVAPIT
jgi:hypothetical protein